MQCRCQSQSSGDLNLSKTVNFGLHPRFILTSKVQNCPIFGGSYGSTTSLKAESFAKRCTSKDRGFESSPSRNILIINDLHRSVDIKYSEVITKVMIH